MATARSSFTADELRRIVLSVDKGLRALRSIEETDDSAGFSSPRRWSVKRKIGINNLLRTLGEVRDFMRGLLEKESGTKRPLLFELFSDNVGVLAHVDAVLDMVLDMLLNTNLQKDPRSQEAKKACASVQSVLQEAGLGDKLAKAREQARRDVDALIPELVRRPSTEVQHFVSEQKVLFNRMKMFENLDEAETEGEVLSAIDTLFDSYSADGSVLTGDTFEQCIQDIMQHIHNEAARVADKYGANKMLPSDEALREWILQVVDPNGDGAITWEEAKSGFKYVVDDIESGADYVKKRSRCYV
jgi:hypothetical protein